MAELKLPVPDAAPLCCRSSVLPAPPPGERLQQGAFLPCALELLGSTSARSMSWRRSSSPWRLPPRLPSRSGDKHGAWLLSPAPYLFPWKAAGAPPPMAPFFPSRAAPYSMPMPLLFPCSFSLAQQQPGLLPPLLSTAHSKQGAQLHLPSRQDTAQLHLPSRQDTAAALLAPSHGASTSLRALCPSSSPGRATTQSIDISFLGRCPEIPVELAPFFFPGRRFPLLLARHPRRAAPAASSSLALLSDVAAAATTSLTRRAASSTADTHSKLHTAAACSFASRVECSTNRRSEPRPLASLRFPPARRRIRLHATCAATTTEV
jgi:hypothetical protein